MKKEKNNLKDRSDETQREEELFEGMWREERYDPQFEEEMIERNGGW